MRIYQSFPGGPNVLSVLRIASLEGGMIVMNNLGVGQRSNVLELCVSHAFSAFTKINSVNRQILYNLSS